MQLKVTQATQVARGKNHSLHEQRPSGHGANDFYHGLLVAALALAVTLTVPAEARTFIEAVDLQSRDDEFSALRLPVLGLAIEWNPGTAVYRVVSVASPATVIATGSLAICERALADELLRRHGEGRFNLALPTLGGVQFWSDVFWYADWRIQEHVYTGHYRLLDTKDERVAWGSFEACRARFESERARRDLQLSSKHLVVLLHGLGRGRESMEALRSKLAEAGFSVASVGYPSTRGAIGEHADGLNALLDRLDDIEQVSFVTHSLGGIVVRAALASPELAWRQRMSLGRIVMLAPPNRGSELARELYAFSPFRSIAGPSAEQLTRELDDIPAPTCPFGIIAASRGRENGLNPFIEGDDDGIVSVEETKLKGAAEHMVVKDVHTFIMKSPAVIEATIRFLIEGRFEAQQE